MNRADRWSILISVVILLTLTGCGGLGNPTGTSNTPLVTGINPSAPVSSSLPRTITVDGTGFQSGLTVTLTTSSGSSHPTASQVTATAFQITAVFGTGSYTIAVANPSGQNSSPFPFAVKSAAGVNFAPRVDYGTNGTRAQSIALADFNNDGKLDIAVSNFDTNTIAVFLNKGDGSFRSPIMTTVQTLGAVGTGPIVAGDFNEDGKMDLIVATIAGLQSDIVLLGNNDGTFTEGRAIPNSFGFFKAKAVDLNGDKHLDLVAGGNGNMTVALGKGDGTFSPAVFLPNGPLYDTYLDIDIGDLTGNGKPDIVGADWGTTAGDTVAFAGNGDGTFNAPTAQSLSSDPESVALADFNGDGKLDILLGYEGGNITFSFGSIFGSPVATASVALGNGDGTFKLSTQTPVYTSSSTSGINVVIARTADLDQDGNADVLLVDNQAGVFTIILNNASSISLGSRYSYTTAPGLCDLVTGDLNGDGMPDVVLVNDQTNQISVFLSQGY